MRVVVCNGGGSEMCVRGRREFSRDVKLEKMVENAVLDFVLSRARTLPGNGLQGCRPQNV